jgi:hypothetical protein
VSTEAFSGERALKLANMEIRPGALRFEVQAVYAFGGVDLVEPKRKEQIRPQWQEMRLSESWELWFPSEILHTMGSMNRLRPKGKYHATVVRKVTSSKGSEYMFNSSQLKDKVNYWIPHQK